MINQTSIAIYKGLPKAFINKQTRRGFFNQYRHGPTRRENPQPDYMKWTRDFFGPKGIEFVVTEVKRQYKRLTKSTLPKRYEFGKTYIFEDFDSDEKIRQWRPLADSDTGHGFSTAKVIRSPAGHALFHGNLVNRLPDDGVTMVSGFVAMSGPQREREKIYAKDTHWDWDNFNCLEIRYRGDGRKYAIILNTGTYRFDFAYYDTYFYPLHTRGGPLWQTLQVPFSKFIFCSASSIQDVQRPIPSFHIKNVNLVLHDTYDGPFSLEVDYIGLRRHHLPFPEAHAYEGYVFPHLRWISVNPRINPPDN